jgi:hypothetical protein
MTLERKGYLWKFHGYTKLHLWGCYLTGGFLAASGSALLVVAALMWSELPDRIFVRLLLLSISCFTASTAVAAGSVFTLVFFSGCDRRQSDTVSPSNEPSIRNDRNA